MNAPLPHPHATTAPRSVFVTSRDGLRLHARIYGPEAASGLPILCLPGLARTHMDFHELALALSSDAQSPRRVITIDYRGRGLSDYDRDWKRYDIRIELDDVLQQMAGLGLEHAVFVGTSRGGLITMAMGAMRPAVIKGVVINDIGPVIEAAGLIRIRGYVGKLPSPQDFAAGADILKRFFGSQFTAFGPEQWETMARRTWKEGPKGLVSDYDPALMKTLEQLDLEAPLPILWPYFDALKHAPMLTIRGENSDIFSTATHAEMGRRHPDCTLHTAMGQGHAPILGTPDVVTKVKRLIAKAERG
ncbi:MAG: alpha/beta fold hydrolase [Bosea sp. (in: a-proteobacteria)]